MWKPGIKIGPENWKERLIESSARYCEVWHNIAEPQKYETMFQFLQKREVHTGLHFWGTVHDSVMANIAHPEVSILEPSINLMKQTIDIASSWGFFYVNIHIGTAALEKIFFSTHSLEPVLGTEVPMEQAKQTAKETLLLLKDYAEKRSILLIVETVPSHNARQFLSSDSRKHNIFPTHGLSSFILEDIAKEIGVSVNNDLSHTAAELVTNSREELWKYVSARTKQLAPYTKLIHSNTLSEPFNGTDSHDGILDEDFSNNVFPTKQQFATLLSMFAQRNDVWIVNEPQNKHVENYNALCAFHDAMQ